MQKKREQFCFMEKRNENYKLFVKYFKRYAYKRDIRQIFIKKYLIKINFINKIKFIMFKLRFNKYMYTKNEFFKLYTIRL